MGLTRCAWCPLPATTGHYGSSACAAHQQESLDLAAEFGRKFPPRAAAGDHYEVVTALGQEVYRRDLWEMTGGPPTPAGRVFLASP